MIVAGLKVGIVTLGCPKNLVDAEVLLGILRRNGCAIVNDPEHADVVIVNTCSFIKPAKEESVEKILQIIELKKQRIIKKIIVTGCLVQEFGKDIVNPLPEVDAFFGLGKEEEITQYLTGSASQEKIYWSQKPVAWFGGQKQRKQEQPRYLLTPAYSTFLKICDGCDNHCSYCIIPSLRGSFRSRALTSLEKEAEELGQRGVKELNIIGQDITQYGRDIYGERKLESLLRVLAKIPAFGWLRLLYLHPAHIDERLLKAICSEEKVVKYIDLPLQHINDVILKRMNRHVTRKKIEQVLQLIRKKIPGAVIRTTCIVGFPGETEEQFQELYGFVKEIRFERLGVFCYSPEKATKAYAMSGQIPERVKKQRRQALMTLQQKISLEKNRELIGSTLKVLVEEKENEGLYSGRTWRDAPDIDHKVYLKAKKHLPVGAFVSARIVEAEPYDLIGVVV